MPGVTYNPLPAVLSVDLISSEIARLSNRLPIRTGPPGVAWNPRLRTTAGRYMVRYHLIELNPHLLTTKQRLLEVLGHEYAHAYACKTARNQPPHGPAWQSAMRALNLEPTACHRYPAEHLRRKVKELKVYECPVCFARWQVKRRYPRNVYHPCAANTRKESVRLVKVVCS